MVPFTGNVFVTLNDLIIILRQNNLIQSNLISIDLDNERTRKVANYTFMPLLRVCNVYFDETNRYIPIKYNDIFEVIGINTLIDISELIQNLIFIPSKEEAIYTIEVINDKYSNVETKAMNEPVKIHKITCPSNNRNLLCKLRSLKMEAEEQYQINQYLKHKKDNDVEDPNKIVIISYNY